MSSLDRILPFLKPIEDLLVDPSVTEVMVNDGGRRVFIEREGAIEAVAGRTLEPRNLTVAIKNIARACGDEISEAQPLLDARLEDGSRVAAVLPPCAVAGAVLTIQVRPAVHPRQLVEVGALPPVSRPTRRRGPMRQRNVLISGGTGTGKTTLLNALAAHIPDTDRVVPHRGNRRDSSFQAERAAAGSADARRRRSDRNTATPGHDCRPRASIPPTPAGSHSRR